MQHQLCLCKQGSAIFSISIFVITMFRPRLILQVVGQEGQRPQGIKSEAMVERSRFLRNDASSRWQYIDGVTEGSPNWAAQYSAASVS